MEVRRDIVIETLTTIRAAADRLEVLEFHGTSAPIVTACRLLERALAKACSDADRLIASRIDPSGERPDPQAPIVLTREALRTVLREELAAVIPLALSNELLAVMRDLRAEQATDGPSVESSSPVAQGADNGSA